MRPLKAFFPAVLLFSFLFYSCGGREEKKAAGPEYTRQELATYDWDAELDTWVQVTKEYNVLDRYKRMLSRITVSMEYGGEDTLTKESWIYSTDDNGYSRVTFFSETYQAGHFTPESKAVKVYREDSSLFYDLKWVYNKYDNRWFPSEGYYYKDIMTNYKGQLVASNRYIPRAGKYIIAGRDSFIYKDSLLIMKKSFDRVEDNKRNPWKLKEQLTYSYNDKGEWNAVETEVMHEWGSRKMRHDSIEWWVWPKRQSRSYRINIWKNDQWMPVGRHGSVVDGLKLREVNEYYDTARNMWVWEDYEGYRYNEYGEVVHDSILEIYEDIQTVKVAKLEYTPNGMPLEVRSYRYSSDEPEDRFERLIRYTYESTPEPGKEASGKKDFSWREELWRRIFRR